jgi:NAD+ kinase
VTQPASSTESRPARDVVLVYQPAGDAPRQLAEDCGRALDRRGIASRALSSRQLTGETRAEDADLVVTFGGDGTILRTARWLAGKPVPIVGVQMGRLGFLAELLPADAPAALDPYLDGNFWLDERAMLEAEIELLPATGEDLDARGPWGTDAFGALCPPDRCVALNDLVIGRGASPRTVSVEVRIDGNPLHEFRCDGLIVATATGSTAYSFAAGGPILPPASTDIVITAICPHMSSLRSVVVPGDTPLHLRASATDPPILSVDGQVDFPLQNEQLVTATLSGRRTRFARRGTPTEFYSRILAKLA